MFLLLAVSYFTKHLDKRSFNYKISVKVIRSSIIIHLLWKGCLLVLRWIALKPLFRPPNTSASKLSPIIIHSSNFFAPDRLKAVLKILEWGFFTPTVSESIIHLKYFFKPELIILEFCTSLNPLVIICKVYLGNK